MDFLELCKKRFSVRSFTTEKVSEEDRQYIMECVRLAPSAVNMQPWKFVMVCSEDAKMKLRKCYDRAWFATAPMYILCLADTAHCWVRKCDGKPHGDIDVAIAAEHICLAAASRGLGSCWVCNFDVDMVKREFCGEGYEPVAIVPIGHIADGCPATEKKRKTLGEIIADV